METMAEILQPEGQFHQYQLPAWLLVTSTMMVSR